MAGTPVSFDNNSLQNEFIRTAVIDHESPGTKIGQVYNIANANDNAIPFTGYSTKMITLSGKIKHNSIAEMDVFMDIFRSYFKYPNRNLDIGYAGGTRRYIGTMLGQPDIKRPGGLKHATFTVTFTCKPFGRDILSTTLKAATGRTAGTYSDIITVEGSAPTQLPILQLTYTAISGGTNKTVTFGNNATGQQAKVTDNYTTGDVLVFDVTKRIVTKNGTLKNFTGAFPEFETGTQSAFYGDDFTSRTFNSNLSYYRQWL